MERCEVGRHKEDGSRVRGGGSSGESPFGWGMMLLEVWGRSLLLVRSWSKRVSPFGLEGWKAIEGRIVMHLIRKEAFRHSNPR